MTLTVYLIALALLSSVGWYTTRAIIRSSVRTRRRLHQPRVVIEYSDALGSGEWCTFPTLKEAQEAEVALNAAYAGAKRFFIQTASLRTIPGYIGSVDVVTRDEWQDALPPAAPRARPKPGTPIVRQRNGCWYVTVGAFTIGYGSGEEGYRAALAAVERAHHPAS